MKSMVPFASSPNSTAAEWLQASLSAQEGAELHSGDSWLELNFSLEVSNANEHVKNPLWVDSKLKPEMMLSKWLSQRVSRWRSCCGF